MPNGPATSLECLLADFSVGFLEKEALQPAREDGGAGDCVRIYRLAVRSVQRRIVVETGFLTQEADV
jgi:hypothetical protein